MKALLELLDRPIAETKKGDITEYSIENGVVTIETRRDGVVVGSILMDEETFRKMRGEPMAGEKRSHICVDFDGVIHMYDSGWKGACEIPDGPVPGALGWLADMVHDDKFQICIYSSRSKEEGAIEAMKAWLKKHFMVFYKDLKLADDELEPASQFVIDGIEFPTQKPAANMTIDDRAFHFEGKFPSANWLKFFKPWNKRGSAQTVLRQELLEALKRQDLEAVARSAMSLSGALQVDDKDYELFRALGLLAHSVSKDTRFA